MPWYGLASSIEVVHCLCAGSVLEQKSATVAFEKYEMILREAARLLPARCKVTLLADRGFNDVELMKLCTEFNTPAKILKKSGFSVRVYVD